MSALFHLYLCGRRAAEWLINMEIDHSIGEERAYWQREKRRLWRSLLTFRRR